MKKFDPLHAREILDDRATGYRWTLSREFERSKALGGLASSAHAYLNMAIECLLVGYDEPATQLLTRARDWLTVAINEHEQSKWPGALRYLDLAMCNWLLDGMHDIDNLNRFVDYEDRRLAGSGRRPSKLEVSLTLEGYVDAGACGQALAWFAKAGLSVPKSAAAARSEAQLCYVMCRHRLSEGYSEAEVQTAAQKVLKRSVNTWLLDGHFARAAEWMKIVHWQEGKSGLSPKEAVLKCYDYLPDVAPPPAGH
jgi:hypothetical protein